MAKVRLQKFMAEAGVNSRRKCEKIIQGGAVKVNGETMRKLPVFVDPDNDTVTVHGKRIFKEPKVYYLLNKPRGVICTNKDPHGRRRAIDFVPSDKRVFCVGRLDADTTGLILLTNDNELANKLTHPRYGITKTYLVVVNGKMTGKAVEKLKKGIWLSDGKTGRSRIKVLNKGHNESAVEITIKQGLNRQIRRMFAKVGLKVKSLKRIKIAMINDKGIGIGKYRPLTGKEVQLLKKAAEKGRNNKKKSR